MQRLTKPQKPGIDETHSTIPGFFCKFSIMPKGLYRTFCDYINYGLIVVFGIPTSDRAVGNAVLT